MTEIDQLFDRIAIGPIDNNLRNSIAELLSDKIDEKEDELGVWEKSLFAEAVSALYTNISSEFQPTDSWLRLCLVSLEKALVPKEDRSEEYTTRNQEVDAITYDMLKNAVNSIKSKLA